MYVHTVRALTFCDLFWSLAKRVDALNAGRSVLNALEVANRSICALWFFWVLRESTAQTYPGRHRQWLSMTVNWCRNTSSLLHSGSIGEESRPTSPDLAGLLKGRI